MSYCTNCGNELPAHPEQSGDPAAEVAEEISSAEVRVAQIQAERDITLARIAAKADTHAVNRTTDADLVEAEAVAETLEDVVTPPEPEQPEPVAVVVDQGADDGGQDQADEPADLPEAESSPAPEPSEHKKSHGYGNPLIFG